MSAMAGYIGQTTSVTAAPTPGSVCQVCMIAPS